MILPADKGNATVVMDRSECEKKIEDMLSENTYWRLKKNPTSTIERKIDQALKQAEKDGDLPKEQRLYLTPWSSSPPQLYGLPQIHKPNTPLRPIVSAIGSPTYKLAKKLAKTLSPLVGHSSSFVKNSSPFTKQIRK